MNTKLSTNCLMNIPRGTKGIFMSPSDVFEAIKNKLRSTQLILVDAISDTIIPWPFNSFTRK